jgi:hypothetical protein
LQTMCVDDKQMHTEVTAGHQTRSEYRRQRGGRKIGKMNGHREQRGGASSAASSNQAQGYDAQTNGDEDAQQKVLERSNASSGEAAVDQDMRSSLQPIETDTGFGSGGIRYRGRGLVGLRYTRSACRRGRGKFPGDRDSWPGTAGESGVTQTGAIQEVKVDSASDNNQENWDDDHTKRSDIDGSLNSSSCFVHSTSRGRCHDEIVGGRGRGHGSRYFVRSGTRRARGAYRYRRTGNERQVNTTVDDGNSSQTFTVGGGEENWDEDTIPITVSTVSNSSVNEDGLAVEISKMSVSASESLSKV